MPAGTAAEATAVAATDAPMHHPAHYRPILDFLAAIGIAVAETPLPADGFLSGILIRDGGLLVDPDRLQWPGDLLHEAGHLAVLPPALRARASDDLADEQDVAHAGEQEAMAWAWAAVQAIGLPPEVLMHEGGYHGQSAAVLQMYAVGIVPGLRGLCESGMTAARGFTPDPGEMQYPRMLRWLRE